MMPRGWCAGLLLLLQSQGAHAAVTTVGADPAAEQSGGCVESRVEPGKDPRTGHWYGTITVTTANPVWVEVETDETHEDLVVAIRTPFGEVHSDLPPGRYAREHLGTLSWSAGTVHLRVFPLDMALAAVPSLRVRCRALGDPETLVSVAWAAAAQAQHLSVVLPGSDQREYWRGIAHGLIDRALTLPVTELQRGALTNMRAVLLERAGQYAPAKDAYLLSAAAWAAAGDRLRSTILRSYAARAVYYTGEPQKALAALRPLLDAEVRRDFPMVWAWASNDHCMAIEAADPEGAARCFQELVAALERMGDIRDLATSLCNQGLVLGRRERWSAARTAIDRCATLRAQTGSAHGLAHATLLLGWLALTAGDTEQAIAKLERSLAAAERTGDVARIWDARRWLAQAWVDADELNRARATLESLAPQRRHDPRRFAFWESARGYVALLDEDLHAARQHFASAAEIFDALAQHVHGNRVRCQWAVIDRAVPLADDCEPLLGLQAALAHGDTARARHYAAGAVSPGFPQLLQRLLALLAAPEVAEEAARQLLRDALHGGTSRDVVTTRQAFLARMGFELGRRALHDNDQPLAAIALAAMLRSDAVRPMSAHSFLIARSAPELTTESALTEIAATPLLRPGETLLASASFAGTTLLLAAPGSAAIRGIEMDSAALRSVLEPLRERQRVDRPALAAVGAMLSLEQLLPPGNQQLLLHVHGDLSQLPWAALPVPGAPLPGWGYRPLIDAMTVVHVVGVATNPTESTTRRIGIFGSASARELPGVRAETKAIRNLADRHGWHLQETNLPAAPARLDILHVGMHGRADFLLRTGGELSLGEGVHWSPVPWPVESIRGTGLVVLGACDSGKGAVSRWQGNYSLAQRALRDGAGAVLAHLWPIADRQAAALHADFYAHRLTGVPAAEALARAQRRLLRRTGVQSIPDWSSAILIQRGLATPDGNPAVASNHLNRGVSKHGRK